MSLESIRLTKVPLKHHISKNLTFVSFNFPSAASCIHNSLPTRRSRAPTCGRSSRRPCGSTQVEQEILGRYRKTKLKSKQNKNGRHIEYGDKHINPRNLESNETMIRESAKKVIFLVARPLRPYPTPPSTSTELSGHIGTFFWSKIRFKKSSFLLSGPAVSPLSGQATKNKNFFEASLSRIDKKNSVYFGNQILTY